MIFLYSVQIVSHHGGPDEVAIGILTEICDRCCSDGFLSADWSVRDSYGSMPPVADSSSAASSVCRRVVFSVPGNTAESWRIGTSSVG